VLFYPAAGYGLMKICLVCPAASYALMKIIMSCLPGCRLHTDEIGLVCPAAGYALIIFIPVLPAIAG
jgi:hypothetical protein